MYFLAVIYSTTGLFYYYSREKKAPFMGLSTKKYEAEVCFGKCL